jgi:DNA-binding transcriptional regulator LsrR (DeoR family)
MKYGRDVDRHDGRRGGRKHSVRRTNPDPGGLDAAAAARFPREVMHAAATMYYLQDATQAEIADRLGTSRATVSRLLSEARRMGVVRIDVPALVDRNDGALARRVATALGLRRVELAHPSIGRVAPCLAAPLGALLRDVGLRRGDIVLVASGRTIYETAQAELPPCPGVVIVPTVGGQDEPEPWYQINEITRQIAAKVGGRPTFLYAPALPGPELHATLLDDAATVHVTSLWEQAVVAILGIGAPPLQRRSISRFIPVDAVALRRAVGDVCLRFFDHDGAPVEFPGSERLIATPFDVLRRIPVTIGLAVGNNKVAPIIAAARAGYINALATDMATADAVLDVVGG